MPVRVPACGFELTIASVALPGISAGPTITPGNNTFPTYTQLIAGVAVTDDVYGIWINVNGLATSGQAKDALAKIGVDPAGGTTFVDLIPDLAVGSASALSAGGGIWFYFQLFIKAGTSIGITVSVNNATVGTCSAFVLLKCKPTGPVIPRMGSFVRAFGSNAATSTGTAIAPANAAKSTYVQIGSALTEPIWAWCLGICINSAAIGITAITWDLALGDATNKRIVIPDQLITATNLEATTWSTIGTPGLGAIGDLMYVRAAAAGASPSGYSAIVYGIGG